MHARMLSMEVKYLMHTKRIMQMQMHEKAKAASPSLRYGISPSRKSMLLLQANKKLHVLTGMAAPCSAYMSSHPEKVIRSLCS